jgi:Family of unknown function (DUF6088)
VVRTELGRCKKNLLFFLAGGRRQSAKTIEEKILSLVYGNGRGWAFSQGDLADPGTRTAIDSSLHCLEKEEQIRRVIRGIYDYPRYSEVLKKTVVPDIDQVAQALARKFAWRIQPDGATAQSLPASRPKFRPVWSTFQTVPIDLMRSAKRPLPLSTPPSKKQSSSSPRAASSFRRSKRSAKAVSRRSSFRRFVRSSIPRYASGCSSIRRPPRDGLRLYSGNRQGRQEWIKSLIFGLKIGATCSPMRQQTSASDRRSSKRVCGANPARAHAATKTFLPGSATGVRAIQAR